MKSSRVMTKVRRWLLPAAIAIIVVFGIWEGLWTNRWAFSHETELAAAKLPSVPKVLGDWVGQDQELDPRQVAIAEMTGYLLRQYTHRVSGNTVQVLLVCGKAGPTALHPPEVCYQGAGYSQVAAPVKHAVKGPTDKLPGDFWVATFAKSGPIADPLRIYWSWTATGTWNAAANPRWTFGASPYLFKLYLIRPLPKVDDPLTDDPTPGFMRLLVPELQKCLFTSTKRQE